METNPYISSSFPIPHLQTLSELCFQPSDFFSNAYSGAQPFDLIRDKYSSNTNHCKKIFPKSPKPNPTVPTTTIFNPPNIPTQIVNNLSARFLINIPQNQKYDVTHILFMCQEAYWFYLDFCLRNYEEQSKQALVDDGSRSNGIDDSFTKYKDVNYQIIDQTLPRCRYDDFTYLLLKHSGILTTLHNHHYHEGKAQTSSPNHDKNAALVQGEMSYLGGLIRQWSEYRARIPVCGAIILDEFCEHILMVKGYDSCSWTFPKGKVDEDESDHDCAVREIYEEIGLDISAIIDPDSFVALPPRHSARSEGPNPKAGGGLKPTKLFIVKGVSRSTPLRPVARYEIKEIKWFPLRQLYNEISSQGSANSTTLVSNGDKFYQIVPILIGLKRALKHRRKSGPKAKAVVDDNALTDDKRRPFSLSLEAVDDSILPSRVHLPTTPFVTGAMVKPKRSGQSTDLHTPGTTMIKLMFDDGVLKTPTPSKVRAKGHRSTTKSVSRELFLKITPDTLFHGHHNVIPTRGDSPNRATSPQKLMRPPSFCDGFQSLAFATPSLGRKQQSTVPDSNGLSSGLIDLKRANYAPVSQAQYRVPTSGGQQDVFANFISSPNQIKVPITLAQYPSPPPTWFNFKLNTEPLLRLLNQ